MLLLRTFGISLHLLHLLHPAIIDYVSSLRER
jgi:hypothetical protein